MSTEVNINGESYDGIDLEIVGASDEIRPSIVTEVSQVWSEGLKIPFYEPHHSLTTDVGDHWKIRGAIKKTEKIPLEEITDGGTVSILHERMGEKYSVEQLRYPDDYVNINNSMYHIFELTVTEIDSE
ncbi:hypothetical protein [Halorussus sp. AFM4]|uniref:hypothetical protein n=1 Tax=Halorussus sp. AFM4 TaxID=3421651 RepID=UPI003EBCAA7E